MPTIRILVDDLSCRVHLPSRRARATMGDRLRFLRSLDAAACRAKGGAPPVNCAARRSLFARADRIRTRLLRTHGIRRIALPPLGCGNGGLDWAEVRPRIEAAFAALPEVEVLLYAPGADFLTPWRTSAPGPQTAREVSRAGLSGVPDARYHTNDR